MLVHSSQMRAQVFEMHAVIGLQPIHKTKIFFGRTTGVSGVDVASLLRGV
jgi:hypothetical protein